MVGDVVSLLPVYKAKRTHGRRTRPIRYELSSCRRARVAKPGGRKRATEQRRHVGLNALEHFDGGCEPLGGFGRRNNEGENFEPARKRPGGLGAILNRGGALD